MLLDVENHHNFAWKERHVINGVEREVVVHRKGATPAGTGVMGIIPGSMGHARLPGARQRKRSVAQVGLPRGWPSDEPDQSDGEL